MNHPDSGSLATNRGIIQPKGFPGLPSGWISEEDFFPSTDESIRLFSILHRKQDSPRGSAVVVLHGQGEHGGRYLHVPHYLKNLVDYVLTFDHRGHGRSEGIRGHIDDFDDYVRDAGLVIRQLDQKLKKLHGNAEIHLVGHSMGGLIALRLLHLDPACPVQTASFSAPLLQLAMKVPFIKKWSGKLVAPILGSLHLESGLDPRGVSHDPEVIKTLQKDHLSHTKVTPRFFVEMERAMAQTRLITAGFLPPLLFLVPLADPIVDSKVTVDFFDRLKHSPKNLVKLAGYFHEILNEGGEGKSGDPISKDRVFEELKKWISTHQTKTLEKNFGN